MSTLVTRHSSCFAKEDSRLLTHEAMPKLSHRPSVLRRSLPYQRLPNGSGQPIPELLITLEDPLAINILPNVDGSILLPLLDHFRSNLSQLAVSSVPYDYRLLLTVQAPLVRVLTEQPLNASDATILLELGSFSRKSRFLLSFDGCHHVESFLM